MELKRREGKISMDVATINDYNCVQQEDEDNRKVIKIMMKIIKRILKTKTMKVMIMT
jgi:hypothetical protein